MKKEKLRIAIDMDNTLTDEMGSSVRPGIPEFLDALSRNHELILWTNSTKARAVHILYENGLREYFSRIIAREDYDPENRGIRKDLRMYDLDVIIDDDPEEISFNKANNKLVFRVESYRKGKKMRNTELTGILHKLNINIQVYHSMIDLK